LKSKHGESLRRAANDRLHDNIEQVMRDKEELECKLIGFLIRIIMMEAQASDSSLNKNNNDGDSSLITNTKNNGG
jgi:hypothetical protein